MSISSPSPSGSGTGLSSLASIGSTGTTSPLQITGLASGLDTNSIINELMAVNEQPLVRLQNQQKGIQALNAQLQGIQNALQGLVTNAQALSSVTLFQDTQTVSSSNSSLVAASTIGSVGAVVGGYQVAVTSLATASQATYGFTSPTAADTVTVGSGSSSKTYSLSAGATAQDLVNAVNADQTGLVWGTVVNGNIVFSNRTTGSASTFTVSDTGGALVQQSSQAGQNAQYSINGGATQTSASNVVQNAIPGITLTLAGTTSTSGPVNVNVGTPTLSTSAIQTAVQNFVTSYNSVLSQIGAQLSQAPSKTDPTQGTLQNDAGLQDLLNNMRQAMYQPGSGLPVGIASMMDIGVSTGATTGSATPSQNAIGGQLTLNTNALTQAIQNNPSGVTAVLQSWSANFSTIVNAFAQAGGTLDSRIQGDDQQINDLGNQISTMQSALQDKQRQLTQQFAAMEAALSQNQSTASWLTSQLNSLPTP